MLVTDTSARVPFTYKNLSVTPSKSIFHSPRVQTLNDAYITKRFHFPAAHVIMQDTVNKDFD